MTRQLFNKHEKYGNVKISHWFLKCICDVLWWEIEDERHILSDYRFIYAVSWFTSAVQDREDRHTNLNVQVSLALTSGDEEQFPQSSRSVVRGKENSGILLCSCCDLAISLQTVGWFNNQSVTLQTVKKPWGSNYKLCFYQGGQCFPRHDLISL